MNIAIIGASSGYGLGIAERLRSEGHRVFVGSRSPMSMLWHYVDVTDNRSLHEFAYWAGCHTEAGVDAVIYSAGVARGKNRLHDGIPDDWHHVFNVNVLGLMQSARVFHPQLEATQGHFIALGSIATDLNYVGGADYCASKAAATSIMKTLRLEWLGTGIRTTIIQPGLGDTNFQLNRYGGNAKLAGKHYGDIRQLQPEDLGSAVSYLLSLPAHVNIDELTIKPLDQATHGVLSTNAKNQF